MLDINFIIAAAILLAESFIFIKYYSYFVEKLVGYQMSSDKRLFGFFIWKRNFRLWFTRFYLPVIYGLIVYFTLSLLHIV